MIDLDFEKALDIITESDSSTIDLGDGSPTYPDFPLNEYRDRYGRLAALLDHLGVDALVFTQEEPIRYLTGYNSVIWAVGRWLPGAFVATRDPQDSVLIPSAFDLGAVGGTSWVPNVDGHGDPMEIPAKVEHHLDRLGVSSDRVGMERSAGSIVMLPFAAASQLAQLLPNDRVDAAQVISALRMIKSSREIERVRAIVSATVAGYRIGLEGARIGMTEKEIVSLVASAIYANGGTAGTRPLFLNAVGGPDRYPLVDSPASDKVLEGGDVMFLDGGAGGDGYMSDIIRLIAFGDITPEQERYADVAAQATQAMVASAVPGARASEVFDAGQATFDEAGIGEWGGGLSGHGIGMEIWERPFIRPHDDPNEDIRLRPGMTLCLEPILVPVTDSGDVAGIFVFEQQVVVTHTGSENLSSGLEARIHRATKSIND